MIQFNLLPDVKQEFIRAKRNQQLITLVAGIVAIACLSILILLFMTVNVLQKKHLSDVNKDIANYTSDLKKVTDLDKILTVQNQLDSLSNLHNSKPVVSRLYGYLDKIVPAKVNISALNLDFSQNTLTLTGSTDDLATVNTFVDTLKFTTFSIDGGKTNVNAFTSVVLSDFSKSDKNASYSVTLNFDKVIFDNSNSPVLSVPKDKITTRSETEKPNALFITPPSTNTQGTGQ